MAQSSQKKFLFNYVAPPIGDDISLLQANTFMGTYQSGLMARSAKPQIRWFESNSALNNLYSIIEILDQQILY